jgi:hypothetical protein
MTREQSNAICDACYKWVKGDGPEPYSPEVADLTAFVMALCKAVEESTIANIVVSLRSLTLNSNAQEFAGWIEKGCPR